MSEKEEPIRLFILQTLADGRSRAPQELAHAFGDTRAKPSDPPDAWRKYLVAVRQQALSMARAGLVEFVRKGVKVDPDDVKGVVRLRLPKPGAEADDEDDDDIDDTP